jgi:TolB-like protein/Flp pilus assembly protein TadD
MGMANFFVELKRRHIYRVGAAYVVVAWALTQLVEILAQVYTLPLWIAQMAIALLAIGFPIALVVTWTIESKPHQAVASAVRSNPTIVDWSLFGAVAGVFLLMAYQQIASVREPGVNTARTASLDPTGAISLAVLPFNNLSSDPEQEFFSDGITEEITAALAKVPDLQVVGRTSAFQFKGQNQDLRAIGQSLNATHLIEGSVRKAGDRVRITVQLIKADNGTHLWSENYDRQLMDIFAIQEDIARTVTASLNMSLGLKTGDQLVNQRNIDPESYEQFLRGKTALLRARGAFREQLAILEPVVAKNPNYAPAWAAVSRAYRYASLVSSERREDRELYRTKATAAAQRSIELDPSLVDGLIQYGRALATAGRWALAEDVLSKALTLDPNDPDALEAYSGMLLGVGRLQEALALKQRLHTLEPYVPLYIGNLAHALWLNGQNDAAIALWKENLDREGAGAHLGLAEIYASLGRYADAAAIASQMLSTERFQPYREVISTAVELIRSAPAKVEAPEKLPRLAEGGFIYLHVGAPERALEFYEEGPRGMNEIGSLWHSSYRVLRPTERFRKFVRDVGLVEYWRARGWPSFCRPTTGDDFACD